jgi:hypothetical protein
LSGTILLSKQGEMAALFNLSTAKIFSINEVGYAIVDFVSTPKMLEHMEGHIRTYFAIENDRLITLRKDPSSFKSNPWGRRYEKVVYFPMVQFAYWKPPALLAQTLGS